MVMGVERNVAMVHGRGISRVGFSYVLVLRRRRNPALDSLY